MCDVGFLRAHLEADAISVLDHVVQLYINVEFQLVYQQWILLLKFSLLEEYETIGPTH